MRNKNHTRHNNLQDIVFIATFILVMGIVSMFALRIMFEVNDKVQADELGLDADAKLTIAQMDTSMNSSLDIGIMIALIVAFLIAGISAMLIDTNPLFFIVGIIYYILSFILIPVFANVYLRMKDADGFSAISSSLPITTFVMNNYVLIWAIMSGLIVVALYAKSRA